VRGVGVGVEGWVSLPLSLAQSPCLILSLILRGRSIVSRIVFHLKGKL